MAPRDRIAQVFLWLAVIGLSVWVGGTIYQMVVVVPMWSHSPPESVRTFFTITKYNETIWNFFGPPFMIARMFPLLAALTFGWHMRPQRRWLLSATACMAIGIVFTLLYIYPINAVLFLQSGGNLADGEIRTMVWQWVWADRIRFVVGLAGFLALLQAFRQPVPVDR